MLCELQDILSPRMVSPAKLGSVLTSCRLSPFLPVANISADPKQGRRHRSMDKKRVSSTAEMCCIVSEMIPS